MTQKLIHTYNHAATGEYTLTVLPSSDMKSTLKDGFVSFHDQICQTTKGQHLKPISLDTIEKSCFVAVLRDTKGNKVAQCLLVTGSSEKRRELQHYPSEFLNDGTLIITSLSSEAKNGEAHALLSGMAQLAAQAGYTHLAAKTHEDNKGGINFFNAQGFTNGTTYQAKGEDYVGHYFNKPLTKPAHAAPLVQNACKM